MNGISSHSTFRSPFRLLVGGTLRLAVRLMDGEAIRRFRAREIEQPEDVFGRPGVAQRLPGETQDEYMVRVRRANEAAIMALGRATIALDRQETQTGMVVARRFRQVVGLQAAAASCIAGLFVLFPDMSSLMRFIILILTPIALARGGLWFVNHASTIGEALERYAERWNR